MAARTFIKLAARNSLRKPARTLLTAGMVSAGVGLLTISIAWINGVMGGVFDLGSAMAGHVRIVDPDFAARESLMPLYENIEDVAPLIATLSGEPGVAAVVPRIQTGVTVTVGEEIGDAFALAIGAPEAFFRERLEVHEDILHGEWFSGDGNDLVVGLKVAEQIEAEVGDELVLLGMTQDGSLSPIKGRIAGIAHAGNPVVDQSVLVPLARMQWLADIPDGATELLVYSERGYEDAEALATRLRENPALVGYDVTWWAQREPWAGMLGMVDVIWSALIFVIVFLTGLGIWNTMMMSVLERTHEIGVLRAMGMSGAGAVALFLVESVVIAIGGGAAGVLLGALPAWLLETRGVTLGEEVSGNVGTEIPVSSTMYADLSPETMLTAFALGLLMALVGSLLPAIRAASILPVSAISTRR